MSEIRWRIFWEAVYRALNMIASGIKKAFLDPTPTDALVAAAKVKEIIEDADV
jgi:hypothetical protein